MTSLPSSLTRRPTTASGQSSARSPAEVRRDLATRRPLVATATLGGAFAAAGPLVVCLGVALVGWFLTDAGSHGEPSDALRVGAFGWLMAHGSGVVVEGARVTALPLALTLGCAWTIWRVGQRVGESVSGHGPDADRIADGERDWTVPLTAGLFTLGYLMVATAVTTLAATGATDPALARVLGFSVLLGLVAGLPAIARGSGRAAIWLPAVPAGLRAAAGLARSLVRAWLVIALLALLLALVLDFSTALNVISQLDASAGESAMIAALTVLVLPNAVLFSSAYLLGPGFTVGAGTLVSPGLVVLGPLPMFPLLAALPDPGAGSGATMWPMVLPLLLAAVVAARALRRDPVEGYDAAAVRCCGGGILAGLLLGALTALAGGAVGPGRMQQVGPYVLDVLLHSVTAFGVGGLLGALAMTAWQRRTGGAAGIGAAGGTGEEGGTGGGLRERLRSLRG